MEGAKRTVFQHPLPWEITCSTWLRIAFFGGCVLGVGTRGILVDAFKEARIWQPPNGAPFQSASSP